MIVIQFYFNSFIGKHENADFFFNLLEKEGLTPDKMGLTEPLKRLYERKKAIELWTKAEQGNGRMVGGMMGKKKNPSYSFIMDWNKGEKYISPNWLTIFVPKGVFKRFKQIFLNIFFQIQVEFDVLYGYISSEESENRQFVPGTLETRLPGVFWCNYFSKTYVDFFGEDRLINGPWINKDVLPNGAIVTYLSDQPTDLINDMQIEEIAKKHLGEDSFGDRDYYIKNLDVVQMKNVPKIELKELRIS
ncbi:hypothetical protein [Bacillus salipaludis]|uniref:GLPGLI family protein n=1 Tax=Bacillus salipaludis TaxID=2547811 RepID=A0ABW8RPY5_9BACI